MFIILYEFHDARVTKAASNCFQLVSDYRTHNSLPYGPYLHVSSEECGYYRYEEQTELATWRPNTPFLNFLYHVRSAF
jgi:hypothetical protein